MEVTTQRGTKARIETEEIMPVPRLEMMNYLLDEPITVGVRDNARIVIDKQCRFFEVVVRFGIAVARQISLTAEAFRRVWNAVWRQKLSGERAALLERLGNTDAAANALTVLALKAA